MKVRFLPRGPLSPVAALIWSQFAHFEKVKKWGLSDASQSRYGAVTPLARGELPLLFVVNVNGAEWLLNLIHDLDVTEHKIQHLVPLRSRIPKILGVVDA
jgi:hypothetical protein